MNELIGRIVANVGIDADAASKAVGMMLGFLQSEGPADKVSAMIAAMPGAAEAMAAAKKLAAEKLQKTLEEIKMGMKGNNWPSYPCSAWTD